MKSYYITMKSPFPPAKIPIFHHSKDPSLRLEDPGVAGPERPERPEREGPATADSLSDWNAM